MLYLKRIVDALRNYEKDGRKAGAMAKWKNEHPEDWELVVWLRQFRA